MTGINELIDQIGGRERLDGDGWYDYYFDMDAIFATLDAANVKWVADNA